MATMEIKTEQDFLRKKTVATFERERVAVDASSGELIAKETEVVRRTSGEPDFIKLYYNVMLAANGISEVPLTFLLGLSAQIAFTNGSEIYFYNNKTTRRAIAEACGGITESMVAKYIKRCVNSGILFPTGDRGSYQVNPWMLAKGRWENIKELQASFEFVAGKWQRKIQIVEGDDDE